MPRTTCAVNRSISSALAGQRAAIVLSLVQAGKLHGNDPWAYLNYVLTRCHLPA
ncbi:hypothetical protein [Variovorax sp. dw_954]|uniref:hypothetical protein n=1 Tax=unclassified Variovorax TaxID=663243 RepID=UPI001BD4652B